MADIQAARVIDLIPGDLVHNGSMSAVYIAQTRHPLWPALQMVVWRLPDGEWSHDALAPAQEVGEVTRSTTADRHERLLAALLGKDR